MNCCMKCFMTRFCQYGATDVLQFAQMTKGIENCNCVRTYQKLENK